VSCLGRLGTQSSLPRHGGGALADAEAQERLVFAMPPRKPAKGAARERKPAMKRGGRGASKAPGAGGAPSGGGGGRPKKASAGALRKAKIPKGDAAAHKQQSYYDVDSDDEDYAGRTKAEDEEFGEQKTEFEDLPSDFDDEEIDEDEAFTEEDKRRYGDVNWDSFASGKKKGKKGGSVDFSDEDFDDDDDLDDDDDALGDDGDPLGDGSDEEEELMLESDEDDDDDEGDDDDAAEEEDDEVAEEDGEEGVSEEDGEEEEYEDDDDEGDSDDDDDDDDDDDKTDALLDDVIGDVRATRVAREVATRGRRLRRGLTEATPESEFGTAPSAGTGGGNGPGALSVASLMAASLGKGVGGDDDDDDDDDARASTHKKNRSLNPLAGARRRLDRLASNAVVPASAPLPKLISERVERKAAYQATGEAVSLWQDSVKANREKPTLKFTDQERSKAPRVKTLASMNATFDAGGDGATDFEKAIMAKIKESGLVSGRDVEKAEDLALNALSAEEASERRARLAKMRNLLFRHELKAKRVKAIKSKTFHRHNRKTGAVKLIDGDGVMVDGDGDDDAALEGLEGEDSAERRREYLRAQERMLLKHKNTSRWAKRAIRKGLAHLPGTKEAIAEQLRIGQELKRKIGIGGGGGGDEGDESSETEASDEDDEDDEPSAGPLSDAVAERRRLARAKTQTLRAIQDGEKASEEEGGLFALPFMAKALRKKREAAEAEARALLEDIERAEAEAKRGDADWTTGDDDDDDNDGAGTWGAGSRSFSTSSPNGYGTGTAAGADGTRGGSDGNDGGAAATRRTFSGGAKASTRAKVSSRRADAEEPSDGNDANGDDANGEDDEEKEKDDVEDGTGPSEPKPRRGAARAAARAAAAGAAGASEAPSSRPATTSTAPRELPRGAGAAKARHAARQAGRAGVVDIVADLATDDGADRDGGFGEDAGLPTADADDDDSQRALLARAFAGDDVVAAFDAEKNAEVEAELPKFETPKRMPGWGGWAEDQAKRPVPKWQVEAEKKAAREKARALKARADADLRRVVISERFDKKAAAFNVEHLPHGFESREVYEGAMRHPLGSDVNTDKSFRDLTRPKVLKNAGAVIRPPTLPKSRKRKAADAAAK
jgi:U3 small nucleolar RNA-associated protein 14